MRKGAGSDKPPSDTEALLAELAASPEVTPAVSLIGTTFGRYRIDAVVGRGGMGVVYRAHDTLLGRDVALKVLPRDLVDDPVRKARLLREARAAASLNHVNVVTLHDVLEHEGQLCIVMELLDGEPLRAFVGGPVPLAKRIGWALDIARALAAAHRAGLVHRDIKPENVMITSDGTVKVLDFGIARVDARAGAPPGGALTEEGAAVGTPRYMSPEQICGDPVDGRTDQFAWAVVVYELLTGALPWAELGSDPGARPFLRIMTYDPPAPNVHDAHIPAELSAAVMRALAKTKDARHQSMEALCAELSTSPESARTNDIANTRPPDIRTPLSGDVAVSGPGVDTPLRIHDAALPISESPNAIKGYQEALHCFRDGNWVGAFDALGRSLAADPDLAPALLRSCITSRTLNSLLPSLIRERFMRTVARRQHLSARDAALLRALEPIFLFEPPDLEDGHRRLGKIIETRPFDAELCAVAGAILLMGGGPTDTIRRGAELALAVDPEYADAWQCLASCLPDDEAACAALTRSVEISPNAADAYWHLALVNAQRGDVKATETNARRSLALGAGWGADLLAGSLYGRGTDQRAIAEALRRSAALSSEGRRSSMLANNEVCLAALTGDFAVAQKHLAEWGAALRDEPHSELHSMYVQLQIFVHRELGDAASAARVAKDFLVDQEMRLRAGRPGKDETALCLAACSAVADDAERVKLASARRTWLETSPDGTSEMGWGLLYGARFLLEDASDALVEEARASCPPVDALLLRRFPMIRFDQGLALLRIGERVRAIDLLRKAARTLLAPTQPFRSTLAHLHLGEALEAEGQREEAIAAYRVVIERWGTANQPSASAAKAKERLAALTAAS